MSTNSEDIQRGMNDQLKNIFKESLMLNETIREWWWCTNDALTEIGNTLNRDNFAIIDNFLPPSDAVQLCSEVRSS